MAAPVEANECARHLLTQRLVEPRARTAKALVMNTRASLECATSRAVSAGRTTHARPRVEVSTRWNEDFTGLPCCEGLRAKRIERGARKLHARPGQILTGRRMRS